MTKGLTNRLPFRPNDSQKRLLIRWIDSVHIGAIEDEPPNDLSKREWKTILRLLTELRQACAIVLPDNQ